MERFQVPGYELGQLLTAGATGELWLARAQDSGEQVALRRLRLPDQQAADQLRRLITLVSMIDHPHLLAYRESIPVGDEFALVMDHPDGGNLDQLLSGRGNLDPGEVVTTIGPIAEALAAAHERDVIHGDIHPESIWYMSDGRPLLADIGLFGLLNAADVPRMHTYADPMAAEPSAAGDVYALAAVCHTAITGIVPNPGQPRPSLQDFGNQESGTKVPNGLVHAVEAGLAEAERRPGAADFTELIYSAFPAAPVRFPVGLALSDADIAAALAQAETAAPPAPAPEQPGQPPTYQPGQPGQPVQPGQPGQPVQPGMPGAPGQFPQPGQPTQPGQPMPPGQGVPPGGAPGAAPGGPAEPVDPFALAASGVHQPNMFGPTPDVVEDEDEEEPRSRLGLWIGVAALAVVLLAGGVIGIWYVQQGRDGSPTAGEQQEQGTEQGSGDQAEGEDGQGDSGNDERTGGNQTGGGDGQDGDDTGTPPADETPEETAWRQRLEDLDRVRAQAFAEPNPALFDQVYAPEATDLKDADRGQLEGTQCGGCRLEGVRFQIKQIEVVEASADQAVLQVTDQRQPYTVVLSTGEEIPQGAGPDQRREFTLTKVDGEWRIAQIEDL